MEEEQDIQSDIVKQKQLRDAQENKEFDREMDAYRRGRDLTDEQRKERLLDNAKLKGNLMASIGFEGGIGVATDIATSPLLISPIPGSRPLYYGINYGVGYLSNLVAQKIRGEQELSQGEALAAGGFQTIPFGTTAKGFKGLSRAVTKGAAGGVVGEQVRVGIDEQRLLTPEEAATGAVVGGAFGGAVKGLSEGTDVLKNSIIQHVENDPYSNLWPYTNRLGLTQPGTTGAMKTGFLGDQLPLFKAADLRKYQKDMRNPYVSQTDRMYLSTSMKGSGFRTGEPFDYLKFIDIPTKDMPKDGRDFLMYFQAGLTKGGASKAVPFKGAQDTLSPPLREEYKFTNLKSKSFQVHHKAALKAIMGIFDGLDFDSPVFREVSEVILKEMPGIGLGNQSNNLRGIIGAVGDKGTPHNLVHKYYNKILGKKGDGRDFFNDEVLQRMQVDRQFRLDKAKELARIIVNSEEIVEQATALWELGFSTKKRFKNFDALVNHLSKFDELGYNSLSKPQYEAGVFTDIITQIALDPSMVPPVEKSKRGKELLKDMLRDKKLADEVREVTAKLKRKKPTPQQNLFGD